MLGFFGTILIVVGWVVLAVSTTVFGQMSALILWVIAALFIVGHSIIGSIEREARKLGQAPNARAAPNPARIVPANAEKRSIFRRVFDWLNSH